MHLWTNLTFLPNTYLSIHLENMKSCSRTSVKQKVGIQGNSMWSISCKYCDCAAPFWFWVRKMNIKVINVMFQLTLLVLNKGLPYKFPPLQIWSSFLSGFISNSGSVAGDCERTGTSQAAPCHSIYISLDLWSRDRVSCSSKLTTTQILQGSQPRLGIWV